MKIIIFISFAIILVASSEKDDWVWNDDKQRSGRVDNPRYQIHENLDDLDNEGPLVGFRPQNAGPYGPGSRPIVPAYQGNKGVLVGPGGPTGVIKRPYYPGNSHVDSGITDSGFLPPWIRGDPRYRDYDTCKCRYSFNCPSSGLKFGSCSREKRYCCFNSRKYPELVPDHSHYPSFPGAPNKFGPGFGSSSNGFYGNRRPQGNFYPGHRYPNNNYHYPREEVHNYPGSHGNHYDNDYDDSEFDFYGRSLNKNQTATDTKDTKA